MADELMNRGFLLYLALSSATMFEISNLSLRECQKSPRWHGSGSETVGVWLRENSTDCVHVEVSSVIDDTRDKGSTAWRWRFSCPTSLQTQENFVPPPLLTLHTLATSLISTLQLLSSTTVIYLKYDVLLSYGKPYDNYMY